MARVCDVCGKGPGVGNSVTTRGKAKYLGGVGTKITGITKRQFKPNLQRIKVTVQGTNRTIHACTQCIRTGSITKLVKASPFKLPGGHKAPDRTAGGKAAGGKAAGGKTGGKAGRSDKPAGSDKPISGDRAAGAKAKK